MTPTYVAKAYARRIKRGEITLGEVPEQARDAVAGELAREGGGA